ITEGSLVSDAARGLGVLARLRLKGFGLAIDDFGTGYSSLAQLSQIPFTELKIDQDFVSGAGNDPRKRAVVEASLDLARKLQLEVVAEGVESPDDWQMLAELGCGFAQGYLIGAAVPGEELPGAVARWRRPAALRRRGRGTAETQPAPPHPGAVRDAAAGRHHRADGGRVRPVPRAPVARGPQRALAGAPARAEGGLRRLQPRCGEHHFQGAQRPHRLGGRHRRAGRRAAPHRPQLAGAA